MNMSIAQGLVASASASFLAAGSSSPLLFGDRVIPVLLDAAVKGALVLAVAWALTALMAKASAAARHLVWGLAIAGLLLLPVLATFLPAWRVLPEWAASRRGPAAQPQPVLAVAARPPSVATATSTALPPPLPSGVPDMALDPEQSAERSRWQAGVGSPIAAPTVRPPAVGPWPEPIARSVSAETTPASPSSLYVWLLIVWCVGSAVTFSPVLIAAFVLWRRERSAHPWTDPAWVSLLSRLRGELGLRRRVTLLRSDSRLMPMTWGAVWPRVLLPAAAEEWPERQRRVVLLHELAHVRRWDCLWQVVAYLAVALYWFDPLVWLAARRMRFERERACDDIVLRAGTPGTEYAERLLTVASGMGCGILSRYGAIAMARPSGLEGRVRAILDARQSRRPMTTRGCALALILFAAAALPLAMLRAADPAGPKPPVPTVDADYSNFSTLPDDRKERIALDLLEARAFGKPEHKPICRDLLATQGKFALANGPALVASAMAAAVEHGWKDLAEPVHAIYERPTTAYLFERAFSCGRELAGRPVPDRMTRAVETLRRSGQLGAAVGDEEIAAARRTFAEDADQEAAVTYALYASLDIRPGKGGSDRGRLLAVDLVKQLDRGMVLRRLRSFRDHFAERGQADLDALYAGLGVADPPVAGTAWGEPVRGLQAGLHYVGSGGPFAVGDTVHIDFSLSNVSDHAIAFTFYKPFMLLAEVTDAGGKRAQMTVPPFDGPVQPVRVVLTSGETRRLGRGSCVMIAPDQAGPPDQSAMVAIPGTYHAVHRYKFLAGDAGDWTGEVATGALKLVVNGEIDAARQRGIARATADSEAGKRRILYYGKPWSAGKPLVDDASGLPVEIMEGCDVTPAFVAETDAFNQTMRQLAAPAATAPAVHPPQAATAPAWPAEVPAWIELDQLDDEIGLPKPPINLRAEQFLRLMDLPQAADRRPRLSKDWEAKLGQPVLAASGNWIVPNDLLLPTDVTPFVSVRRLSADRAIVMILKPRGSYLWHHYYECLATFDVARGPELDAWLGLDALQAAFTVVHRGIGHGATAAAATKALGEPDAVVRYQAMEFYQAYYFEGDVGLQFQNGTVRRVTRGVPRSVKAAVAKKGKTLGPEDVREDEPAAPAGALLSKARDAIAAVQARCKDDAALKPLSDGTAREVGSDLYDLTVETPDRWDGFPSKVGPPTRGSGSIAIRVHQIVRPSDRAWTPFVAPPGCWVGRNWLDGPDGLSVLVYSQLGDRAAHRRLISLVAQEFGKAGIGLGAVAGDDMESHGRAKEAGRLLLPPAGGDPPPAAAPVTRPAADARDRPDAKNADAQAGWGEAVSGLQLRLTLPAGAAYARGRDPVLRMELRNVARPPVSFHRLPVRIDAELTAADGSRIADGTIEVITPWEGREGAVVGGASLTWDVPFGDVRHRDTLAAGSAVQVRVRLPFRGPEPRLTGPLTEVFSGVATVAIRDEHPQPLADADVPAAWEKSFSVGYAISAGLRGTSRFHVDGEGRATYIAAEGLLGDRGVRPGRYEAVLGPGDLDRLAKALREARVWELGRIPEGVPFPDEGMTFVSVANGGASLARSFPQRTVENLAALKPLQAELTRLTQVVVAAAKAEREMWERSAVASMRAFLARKGGGLAAEVGPFVDNPTRGMRVADGPDNAYVIARLRDNDPAKARYADIDPREAVVVSVFGPKGGAFELGVVLDRKTGRERAVALVPGK